MRPIEYILFAPLFLAMGCAEPSGFEDAVGTQFASSTQTPAPQSPDWTPAEAPAEGSTLFGLGPPQTWRVSVDGIGEGVPLKQAIEESKGGDILLLSPGRYVGALEINHPLTLMKDPDAPGGEVILDGDQSPATLSIMGVREPGVRLEGLTITGASLGLGKGIDAIESDLVLSDVKIRGNGKGCRLMNSNTQVIRSEISHNLSSSGGAGLVVEGFGSTLILNTLIARNQGTVGGGILLNGGLLTLRHTAVIGNLGTGEGGGIYVQSHPVIEATLLLQNSIIAYTTQGSGLYVHDELARVEALGTIVWNNAAGDFQGVPIDFRPDLGNRAIDPGFVGVWPRGRMSLQDLYLKPSSPLINAAMGEGGDPDGTRADIGLHGGLQARFAFYEDRDGDGLYDGWESEFGLKPWRRDALADEDLDGLTNLEELHHGLNPRHSDTDGDGIDDRLELNQGSDPANPFSPSPIVSLSPEDMPLDMAILRAPSGAELNLSAGTWTGRFTSLGKALVIRGQGEASTLLDGGGFGPVLRFDHQLDRMDQFDQLDPDQGPEPRVEHLTIRGGVGSRGGGVYIRNTQPRLHRVTIEGNSGELGGGIYSSGGSPTLTEVTLRGNQGLNGGGALFIAGGDVTLESCRIEGNEAPNGGGIAFSESGDHTLRLVTMDGNSATKDGGAISLLGETQVYGESLIISNNRAQSGGGIYIADGALDLVQSTLVHNRGERGGGMSVLGSPRVRIEASIVAYQSEGGGLVSDPRRGGSLDLNAVLFWANGGGDLLGEAQEAQPLPPESFRGDPYFWSEPCKGEWRGVGLQLGPKSAAIDAAPWLGSDLDGSPRDLGASGGPLADASPLLDLDEDGLPDGWERLWNRDLDELDTFDDLDGDGLSNVEEFRAGLDPTRRDTDRDGIRDGDELSLGSDPRAPLPIIILPSQGFRSPLQVEPTPPN